MYGLVTWEPFFYLRWSGLLSVAGYRKNRSGEHESNLLSLILLQLWKVKGCFGFYSNPSSGINSEFDSRCMFINWIPVLIHKLCQVRNDKLNLMGPLSFGEKKKKKTNKRKQTKATKYFNHFDTFSYSALEILGSCITLCGRIKAKGGH